MLTRTRENAVWVALAAASIALLAWQGLGYFGWNDYDNEALPAVNALIHGHLNGFFRHAPVYGGSLLERAPFALAPTLWGGGELAVYRMMALPCLLAVFALGLWLVARMGREGQGRPARALVLALCVANPLVVGVLEVGHPEELLGGALCVAAVLLAARERPVLAGLALGAAIANKQWALLALGPVLLALPGRRILCGSVAGSVAVLLFAPFALFAHGAATTMAAASPSGAIFLPAQLWWFLGNHDHVVMAGLTGIVMQGYRSPPAWVGPVSHPLIVALVGPLTLAAWFASRRAARGAGTLFGSARPQEAYALLLLSLLLALRFMLDPWDNFYYPVPFLLALAAWEALARRRPPLLAVAGTAAIWAGQRWVTPHASPDAQAAFFAAWSVPLAAGLGFALYAPNTLPALLGRLRAFGWSHDRRLPVISEPSGGV